MDAPLPLLKLRSNWNYDCKFGALRENNTKSCIQRITNGLEVSWNDSSMPPPLEEWWTFSRILQVYATYSPSPFHSSRWPYRNIDSHRRVSFSKFYNHLFFFLRFFFFWISFFWRCHFFSRMMKSKIVLEIFTIWKKDTRVILSILKKKWKKEKGRFKTRFKIFNFIAVLITMNFISTYIKTLLYSFPLLHTQWLQKVSYTSLQLKKFILPKNPDFNENYT